MLSDKKLVAEQGLGSGRYPARKRNINIAIAESFNLFNTVNLGQPNSVYSAGASTFGSINSGSATNTNRRIQFGLIVYF